MTTTWLSIEPLDTIMVRDGRSFIAGDVNRAQARTPAPSTLGGAVAAAWGERANPKRLLGPAVSVDDRILFPVPADVVRAEDPDLGPTTARLAPAEREGGAVNDLDDRYRLSHALVGDGDPVGGWITRAGLAEWLRQGTIGSGRELDRYTRPALVPDQWLPESHIGLARGWDGPFEGVAAPSMLYSAAHLRPVEGLRFLVGCEDPDPVTVVNDVVALGGRGRMASVTVADVDPFPGLEPACGRRLAVYLATPALFDDVMWHPPQARLCALAVTGPYPIATASPRAGFGATRRLRWCVPAGSVYFLEFDTDTDAETWARQYHGGLLPQTDDPTIKAIVTAGFGTCLIGRW